MCACVCVGLQAVGKRRETSGLILTQSSHTTHMGNGKEEKNRHTKVQSAHTSAVACVSVAVCGWDNSIHKAIWARTAKRHAGATRRRRTCNRCNEILPMIIYVSSICVYTVYIYILALHTNKTKKENKRLKWLLTLAGVGVAQ